MNTLPCLALRSLLLGTLLLSACAHESEKKKEPDAAEPPSATAEVETKAPPAPVLASGVDKSNFDPVVRPQDDLYRAVNGAWLARTRIPSDKSNYGAFTALADEAEAQLRVIIEELAAMKVVPPNSIEQKVGDTYAAFMDESRIEGLGLEPIQKELEQIDSVKDRRALLLLMARLYRTGVKVPLAAYVHQDAKDATRYAGDFDQSGLSLPNRDFYLIQDEKFKGIRAAFHAHVERMVTLTGSRDGRRTADVVLALETRLAKHQWDKVALRDPVKRYNPYPVSKLPKLAPQIDWVRFLDEVGFGSLDTVLVSQPSYVTELGKLLKSEPLSRWKTYLKWQVLTARAELLPRAYVEENFAFFGRTLNGIEENEPRWKRGVAVVEQSLGEAVGQVYVARHFPAQNKARMEALVANLVRAYGKSIDELDWMGQTTRRAAREKLSKFVTKIGYPRVWRDYGTLQVKLGDAIGNQRRASEFEYARDLAKLGKPIDREEWGMTPQTVNAYYNAEMNEIVFPAAILQPPFFDVNADDAVNYGAIGAVIGHEISHGFDDKGSQYDGDGNLRMWWTPEDRARFDALGARLAAQYDAYEPVPGYHVDGNFTLGENIADLGGLSIAYRAYKLSLEGREGPVIDGLTADQRFFIGWAQAWRRLYRQENLLNRLKTDPHSPSEYRCNGVVQNIPAFQGAFGIQQGDRMYRDSDERLRIW
jgi:predicted metalloendopeptidase